MPDPSPFSIPLTIPLFFLFCAVFKPGGCLLSSSLQLVVLACARSPLARTLWPPPRVPSAHWTLLLNPFDLEPHTSIGTFRVEFVVPPAAAVAFPRVL